jgi:hypothetical protein
MKRRIGHRKRRNKASEEYYAIEKDCQSVA